jgi:hypothetical protein
MRDGSPQQREDYVMREYEHIKVPYFREQGQHEQKKKLRKKRKPM